MNNFDFFRGIWPPNLDFFAQWYT